MPPLELDSDEACALAYRLRLKSGMTQSELALATGLSVSTISRYETGRSTPSRPALERLASGAGVALAEVERDLTEAWTRFRSPASPPTPPSSAVSLSDEETSRLIAETLRSPGFRSLQSELGVNLDGILAAKGRGYGSPFGGLDALDTYSGGGASPALGLSGAQRPAAASAVEVRPWLMMRKAIVHHAMGDDRKAAEELSFATLSMSGSATSGPRFVFYVARIAFLLAAGNAEGAHDLLTSLEEVARALPPPGESLRLRWVRARVAGALGQRGRQSALLRELEAEFTDLEMPLETLCAWADRVALELEETPHGAARPVGGAPDWVLEGRGLHPSMAEGLATLRALLADGTATPAAARRFVAFLLCAHIDPGIPFEPRSRAEPEPPDEFDFSY